MRSRVWTLFAIVLHRKNSLLSCSHSGKRTSRPPDATVRGLSVGVSVSPQVLDQRFHTARMLPVPDKTGGACVHSREIAMLIPHIHSRSTTARRFIT